MALCVSSPRNGKPFNKSSRRTAQSVIYFIMIDTIEFVSEPLNGFRLLKRVDIVFRPPNGSGEVATNGTLMQTRFRVESVQYTSTPELENTMAIVTDFMFVFISGRVCSNYQMIERELRMTAVQCT